MRQQVLVMVGTNKGAFFFNSDANRREWRQSGPYLSGWEVSSILADSRCSSCPRLLAGTSHAAYGPTIRLSDDLGQSWTQMVASPRHAPESGATLKRIWQIVPGVAPGTYYAGTEDAGLFASSDSGVTWRIVDGLARHPSRPTWRSSRAGVCLHSILLDPGDAKRLWVGIAGGGVFRSTDGGERWTLCQRGLPAPEDDEAALCTHKLAMDPTRPDTLYLQYHRGVFVSRDGGDCWQPIDQTLPSSFGFPLCVTPNGRLFVVPLAGDDERYMQDGQLRLYRSGDSGRHWEAVGDGLPAYPSYVSVLRDAMATDALDPPGIYFGTTAGEVFYSADEGERWQALPGRFSRITVVRTWQSAG